MIVYATKNDGMLILEVKNAIKRTFLGLSLLFYPTYVRSCFARAKLNWQCQDMAFLFLENEVQKLEPSHKFLPISAYEIGFLFIVRRDIHMYVRLCNHFIFLFTGQQYD